MKTAPPNPAKLPETGLPIGARLGKYEVLDRVGRGGMAVVYRARDTLLNRMVAIKQIAPHLIDDQRWRERFKLEAQTIARVATDSRNIVQIHELVEDASGIFIIMEFVEGHTLATLIREHKVDLQLGLDVLACVCMGLRAVHAAGIIHRDIKPGNIIVPPDRRAKITDFGVAAHSGGETSMALGTTKYMAPELFSAGRIDARVDIYSLGLVAFEMFAGREAWEATFAGMLGDARSEALRWMNWHTRMDQALPRLDVVNPQIPAALAELVALMAAKSLSVRLHDINAVIAELRRAFPPASQSNAPAASEFSAPASIPTALARPPTALIASRQGGTSPVQPAGAGASPGKASEVTGMPLTHAESALRELQSTLASLPKSPSTAKKGSASAQHAASAPRAGAQSIQTQTARPPLATSVFDTDAPTADIPKPINKRRRGLYVALAASLLFAVSLVVASFFRGPDELQDMTRLYKAGLAAYQANQFDDALAKWREAVTKQASGAEADKGREVLRSSIPLAEARLALAQNNPTAALAKVREAETLGAKRDAVERIREEAAKRQAIAELRATFDKQLADGDLEAASATLRDVEERHLADAATVAALRQQLDTSRNDSSFIKQFKAARAAFDRGAFEEAMTKAQAAQSQQDTPQIRQLIDSIRKEKDFAAELKAGREALAVSDFKAAAQHFESADRLKPGGAAVALLRQARANEQRVAAESARRDGKLSEAAELYRKAIEYGAGKEVETALRGLESSLALQLRIDEGQRAADDGQWDRAVTVWQKVLEGGAADREADLRAKIGMAQVQVAMKRGEAHIKDRQWDAALSAFKDAERLGGGEAAAQGIARVKRERQVEALLAQGDTARDAGQHSQAMRLYRDAMKLLGETDPEIQKRIDEVSFRQFKSDGLRELNAGKPGAALAFFNQAHRLKPKDAEIKQLIQEAEKRKRDAANPDGG